MASAREQQKILKAAAAGDREALRRHSVDDLIKALHARAEALRRPGASLGMTILRIAREITPDAAAMALIEAIAAVQSEPRGAQR